MGGRVGVKSVPSPLPFPQIQFGLCGEPALHREPVAINPMFESYVSSMGESLRRSKLLHVHAHLTKTR